MGTKSAMERQTSLGRSMLIVVDVRLIFGHYCPLVSSDGHQK